MFVRLEGVTVAAVVAAAAVVARAAGLPGDAWAALIVTAVLAGASVAVAYVVSRTAPGNPVGPLLGANGVVSSIMGFMDAYQAAWSALPAWVPRSPEVVGLSQFGWMWLYVPFACLCVVFPTGRADGRVARTLLWGLPALALVALPVGAVAPLAYAPPLEGVPHPWGQYAWANVAHAFPFLTMAGLIAAAVILVRRLRSEPSAVVRAQLTWMAAAGLTIPITLFLCWVSYLLLDGPDLAVIGLMVMFVGIHGATLMGMMRFRLFDADRAFVGTALYVALALLAVTTYVVVSAVVGSLVADDSVVPAALGAAACAACLAPARAWLRPRMRRALLPAETRAVDALARFSDLVRRGEAEPEGVEGVLRAGCHHPALVVAYADRHGDGWVDAAGAPVSPGDDWSRVALGDAPVAALSPSPEGVPVSRTVSDAAALLLDSVRLRTESRRLLREVDASRARLMAASYEERRRLERDLHDGAQLRLVSLGVNLRVAQHQLARGVALPAGDLLDDAIAEIGTTVSELRQIAHGLRPSCLDDGLGPALAELTRRTAVPVDVQCQASVLADDVTTVAYFVAAEAVANAVKHAAAGRIAVGVLQDGGEVEISVRDDGRGGAVVRPGSGLAGLADRVHALGGRLTLQSPPGKGTELRAVLPCASS